MEMEEETSEAERLSTEESLPVLPSGFILSFLGVKQQDLPYHGKKKAPDSVEAVGAPFRLTASQSADASQLLFNLTGVSSQVCNGSKATRSRVTADNCRKEVSGAVDKEFGGGFSGVPHDFDQQNNVKRSPRKVPSYIEKSLDTCDLGFWSCMVLPDKKSKHEEENISDAESEEQEQVTEKTALQEKPSTEDCAEEDEHKKQREYWARVRETLGFVQMRLQMLQELSVGAAVKRESSMTIGASKDSQESNASFVNGAGINIKQARKLAGLVHMEEQALHLQDLHQWLHNVGNGLEDDATNAHPKSALQNKLEYLKKLNIDKESREPIATTNASSELLQQFEHNLRDRLANLYQGKNFILRNQTMSEKLETEAINAKEGTLERLQKIESAYEMLGSTIIDSLRQVEKMEDEFHVLQAELQAKGCPLLTIKQIKKMKKSRHKGTKKSSHSENDGASSPSEVSSVANSSRVASAKSERENGDIDGNGNGKDKSEDANDINNHTENGNTDTTMGISDENEMMKSGKSSKNGKKKEKNKKSHAQKTKMTGEIKTNTVNEGKNPENSEPHAATTEISKQVDGTASQPTVVEVPHLQTVAVKDLSANGKMLSENRETLLNTSGGDEEHQPTRKSTFSMEKRNTSQELSFSVKDGGNIRPHNSEAFQNNAKSKRQSRRSCFEGYTEEAVQTDDVAIISLEDGCDNAFSSHYEQMDVKDMVENMKKMQKQLQFWRAKNWATKHTGNQQLLQAPVYSSVSQFTKLHTVPDMGLVLYYNPQTGLHTIKSVSDLDPTMQKAIVSLTSEI